MLAWALLLLWLRVRCGQPAVCQAQHLQQALFADGPRQRLAERQQ
jgi:hypothetical protein